MTPEALAISPTIVKRDRATAKAFPRHRLKPDQLLSERDQVQEAEALLGEAGDRWGKPDKAAIYLVAKAGKSSRRRQLPAVFTQPTPPAHFF